MAKKSSCEESFHSQAPVHHTQHCCNSHARAPAPAATASFWWGPVVISDSATLMSCQKWACVSYIRVCLKCIRQSRLQSAAGISPPSNFYRLQTNGKHKSGNQRVQVTFYIFSLLSWGVVFFPFHLMLGPKSYTTSTSTQGLTRLHQQVKYSMRL